VSLKEQIQALAKDQEQLAELERVVFDKTEELLRLVEARCKELQNKLIWVKFHPRLRLEHVIWVTGYHEPANSFIQIEGEWCWYDGEPGHKIYAHKILREPREPLFDVAEVMAACKALEEELGIEVVMEDYTVATNVDHPNTPDDLLALYPGGEILEKGSLWREGWDIPDSWAIVKDAKGGLHMYHSANGHGMGYDYHAASKDELDCFLDRLEQPGFEGASRAVRILQDAGWVK